VVSWPWTLVLSDQKFIGDKLFGLGAKINEQNYNNFNFVQQLNNSVKRGGCQDVFGA
jgi:hypothetical protein